MLEFKFEYNNRRQQVLRSVA